MKKLKIGIMPGEEFQQRMLEIASGKRKLNRSEPKVWFSSMKSLSEVLSDNNVRLLKLIKDHRPESLKELAALSGRESSNLSRTLKTMEKYGIVELRRRDSRKVQPVAIATEFDIQYAIA